MVHLTTSNTCDSKAFRSLSLPDPSKVGTFVHHARMRFSDFLSCIVTSNSGDISHRTCSCDRTSRKQGCLPSNPPRLPVSQICQSNSLKPLPPSSTLVYRPHVLFLFRPQYLSSPRTRCLALRGHPGQPAKKNEWKLCHQTPTLQDDIGSRPLLQSHTIVHQPDPDSTDAVPGLCQEVDWRWCINHRAATKIRPPEPSRRRRAKEQMSKRDIEFRPPLQCYSIVHEQGPNSAEPLPSLCQEGDWRWCLVQRTATKICAPGPSRGPRPKAQMSKRGVKEET